MSKRNLSSGKPRVHVSFAHQKAFAVFPDGTVEDSDRRLMHVGLERFVADIALGDCCFMCGVARGQANFNDEHVIPNWILKAHKLHAEDITLSNGRQHRYGSYKVPCCSDCNTHLGQTVETPISAAIKEGYGGLIEFCARNGPLPLFAWMALLFLKTHLKDKTNPIHQDVRSGTEMLATLIPWTELHHAYCVARLTFGSVGMQTEALGSLMILRARTDEPGLGFDFSDLTAAQTIMIRLGSVVVIAVMNDSFAAASKLGDWLPKLGSLSALQYRELMAHAAYINLRLKERPKFFTVLDKETFQLEITVERPTELQLKRKNNKLRSALMMQSWRSVMDTLSEPVRSKLENAATSGIQTTLWDKEGSFKDEFYIEASP